MLIDGLLPIGSVVLLKNSTKRVMIIGVAQEAQMEDGVKIYDYAGCLFPEGFLDPNQNFLFNGDQIERLFFIGYQDDEALEFKDKADALMAQLRSGKTSEEDMTSEE